MKSTFQGTFKAETYPKSKFKPKKVVVTIEEITPLIKSICNDVSDITNAYNDLVSNSVNSSEWINTAKQITQASNDINLTLKKAANDIISHIIEIYNEASAVNKQLSFEITEQKEKMANSLSQLNDITVGDLKAPTSSNYEASTNEPVTETKDTIETIEQKENVQEKQKEITGSAEIETPKESNETEQIQEEVTSLPKEENIVVEQSVTEPSNNTPPQKGATDIPSSVKQSGITKNYTNYDYFYNRWSNGTNQRNVADQWAESGRTSNNGIATIDDRYLVAVSTKFGNVGDNIDVVLDDGTVINCKIADAKGSDATSEWGHVLGGGGVDVIEWESVGGVDVISIDEWQGKKVSTIINTGN